MSLVMFLIFLLHLQIYHSCSILLLFISMKSLYYFLAFNSSKYNKTFSFLHQWTGFNSSDCNSMNNMKSSLQFIKKVDNLLPEISPSGNPEPLYPLLAPSPLSPFTITNNTAPKLSGALNFVLLLWNFVQFLEEMKFCIFCWCR